MDRQVSTVEKIRIDYTDVYLEDYGEGKGKIVISDPGGHNHSYYWGSMGSSLKDFLCTINAGYFADKLMGTKSNYVPDWKKTFASLRKFIRDEIGLKWYEHKEFQIHMREVLNDFQTRCEESNSKDFFVALFQNRFIDRLHFYDIKPEHERKILETQFNSIDEPWHFIVDKPGPEYICLEKLHKKLKRQLNLNNNPTNQLNNVE